MTKSDRYYWWLEGREGDGVMMMSSTNVSREPAESCGLVERISEYNGGDARESSVKVKLRNEGHLIKPKRRLIQKFCFHANEMSRRFQRSVEQTDVDLFVETYNEIADGLEQERTLRDEANQREADGRPEDANATKCSQDASLGFHSILLERLTEPKNDQLVKSIKKKFVRDLSDEMKAHPSKAYQPLYVLVDGEFDITKEDQTYQVIGGVHNYLATKEALQEDPNNSLFKERLCEVFQSSDLSNSQILELAHMHNKVGEFRKKERISDILATCLQMKKNSTTWKDDFHRTIKTDIARKEITKADEKVILDIAEEWPQRLQDMMIRVIKHHEDVQGKNAKLTPHDLCKYGCPRFNIAKFRWATQVQNEVLEEIFSAYMDDELSLADMIGKIHDEKRMQDVKKAFVTLTKSTNFEEAMHQQPGKAQQLHRFKKFDYSKGYPHAFVAFVENDRQETEDWKVVANIQDVDPSPLAIIYLNEMMENDVQSLCRTLHTINMEVGTQTVIVGFGDKSLHGIIQGDGWTVDKAYIYRTKSAKYSAVQELQIAAKGAEDHKWFGSATSHNIIKTEDTHQKDIPKEVRQMLVETLTKPMDCVLEYGGEGKVMETALTSGRKALGLGNQEKLNEVATKVWNKLEKDRAKQVDVRASDEEEEVEAVGNTEGNESVHDEYSFNG